MTLPQPPPGVPAPPPSQQAIRSRRMFSGVIALTILGALGILVIWPLTYVRTCCGRTSWTEAINNGMMIHLVLMEFDGEYGAFPDGNSALTVVNRRGSDLPLGTATSNDFFRQLMVTGYGDEKRYHARIKGSKRPDGIEDRTHALEKGECGFSYIPGYKSSSNARFPLLVTPLVPGTDRIDPIPFEGKALVLTVDGNVGEAKTDRQGHVIVFGKRLLDPTNPIWEGRTPVIAWPE